ncbi:MAG: twin-arginine translocase TatA/TatE family subunit [Alphaproteobacteria bacterium]|nr:twin-arginine translocase TatA/TatE family subunit [Alphaproteobacteria bacterium]MBF0251478.1 twin-arginine translocase TatA/TatE family subunit [Alphaproteobacteria bacterium]
MGVTGIWQWVVVLAIILLLFGGRGKISALMGDFGKGLKSFKKGLKDEGGETADKSEAIENKPAATIEAKVEDKDKAS